MPYETVTPQDCLMRNVVGGNAGNLVYQYSVFNSLATEDMEFETTRYQANLEDAERISQECQAFVIPLADAFRPTFMQYLKDLTALIKKLTIPCIVIGVGIRAAYEPDFSGLAFLDEDVKNFVNAVLEKSAKLGLRGEFTATYLKKLGYREEKDFTIIGCPSAYLNGAELCVKEVKLNTDSKVSLNSDMYPNLQFSEFLRNVQKDYPNYRFVGQIHNELRLLYTGCPFPAGEAYPCKNTESPAYVNQNARYFINVPLWIEHMKKMD
ncbi:polysaccharide pyruvyl transferase family protein [[Clostridium] polysaccharolyticum]|uniref:Polysaccharide pyruvyl transferase n=1 Tax=[Clostridium] polysaccharolyticum TaxID=29364 RepID=A0A1I0C3W2_9FIRM|nr:polysaccharide pyruvyl transferase family protein [[Clostridium] polysaccharolyticum]SET13997.1 Polysaccharide pyruvyl transferase [[Clostridium] polysaccharolyticum]